VSDLNQKIDGLLAENLGIKQGDLADDLAMKDVGSWDSLKHMELIVAIEQSFDLQLSFDEIVTMTSVGEIRRVVNEKCAVA
jgi:acyl carrier protein